MSDTPKVKLFVHSLVVDRDAAIAFLKSVGFEQTPDAAVFARDTERSAAQKAAGARALVVVNVDALINARHAWRVFVQRWTKKLAKGNP